MVTISPHMYCGLRNPEMEATPEVEHQINEMLYRATEPSTDRSVDYKMPPNGYFVHYPGVQVHVANGTIALRCFGVVSYVKDTVGLEKFLAETLAPCIEKHYEEMSGVSKQEKV